MIVLNRRWQTFMAVLYSFYHTRRYQ